jgi:hypothetical protein
LVDSEPWIFMSLVVEQSEVSGIVVADGSLPRPSSKRR